MQTSSEMQFRPVECKHKRMQLMESPTTEAKTNNRTTTQLQQTLFQGPLADLVHTMLNYMLNQTLFLGTKYVVPLLLLSNAHMQFFSFLKC